MGFSEPISSEATIGGGDDFRIESRYVACHFIPTVVDLVAQAEVNGQIWTQFNVVLDKHLRTLQACAILWANFCVPMIDITQQEVGIFKARSRIGVSYASGIN